MMRRQMKNILTRFDDEFDCSAFAAIDLDIGKGRNADEIDAVRCHEAASNGYRLDRLVQRSGTYRLHFSTAVLTNDSGKSSGDGIGVRFG